MSTPATLVRALKWHEGREVRRAFSREVRGSTAEAYEVDGRALGGHDGSKEMCLGD